jgi:thiol-disulfide isomerase/thioredoxin
MTRKYFLLFFIFGILGTISAQENDSYKIEVKIKDKHDTVLYLANYYGDKTYLADTAYNIKGKGDFIFHKDEALDGGLYIIVSQNKKSLFEFLVSDSRNMKFETEGDDFISNMKIHGSDENDIFYEYLRYSGEMYEQVKPLNEKLKNLDPASDSAKIIKTQIEPLNEKMIAYKEKIMEDYPKSFLSNFFHLLKEPAVPDSLLTLPDGTKDSAYPYRYYKTHYWDGINLTDDRLVRTPVYSKKLDSYFDQVISKEADSIMSEIDRLLAKMNENSDLFKFTLWHLTIKYDESQIMGHDAILVHMSDKYFSKGKATWLDKGVIKNIMEEADKRRATLIGKQAPNLIMQDTNFQPRSLYDLKNKYVILFFWDPNCGHCKKEIPHLVDFYKNYAKKLDAEVFAVCTDTNMKEMKDAIKDRHMSFINVDGPRSYTSDYHDTYNIFSTPVLIVLNKERAIIAKRLMSEQLAEFLENYEKYSAQTKDDE